MSSFDKVMAAHVEARKYGESFVDFTNDLLSGVISTLVKAGMDQMTSYAELIQAISVGQSTFQENVTGLDKTKPFSDAVNLPILDNYIEEVFAGINVTSALEQQEADSLIGHFNGITINTGTTSNVELKTMSQILDPELTITKAELQEFVYNKLISDAAKNYDTLVTLVREGWIKVLPTDWKVSTDLSFHITSDDTSSIYSSYYKQKVRGWQASRSGSFGFNIGKILSMSSTNAGSVSGSKLRVSTQSKSETSNLTSDVLYKGHVSVSGTAVQHPSVTIEPSA